MSDIFESDCQAIVNTVNCVGVMGKGLAKQFKERYPAMFCDYRIACQHGRLDPGRAYGWYDPTLPIVIYNFTTKDNWRNPSTLEWIIEGLADLRAKVQRDQITSIAIPPLGCGNGGLHWEEVEPLIREALGGMGIRVVIYPPSGDCYEIPC